MSQFPLFAFTNDEVVVITRGPTLDHAFDYATQSKNFRRGTTIRSMDHLPIEAAKLYDENHDSGWLTRPPKYLNELEKKC